MFFQLHDKLCIFRWVELIWKLNRYKFNQKNVYIIAIKNVITISPLILPTLFHLFHFVQLIKRKRNNLHS